MTYSSTIDVLVLHAVRTLGYADTSRIAARRGIDLETVAEHLLDAEARGWVTSTTFGGDQGWSLTEAGKSYGEQLLAAELEATGARDLVAAVHEEFLPLNATVTAACSAWQLAEIGVGGTVVTREETIMALEGPGATLQELEVRLTARLTRYAGYYFRFSEALARAAAEPAWITGTDRDSCHSVWFELHEDLIATLALSR